MIIALLITWLFWGSLVALEIYWKRSWYLLLIPPSALSALWFLLSLVSDAAAFYSAITIHLVLLMLFIVRLIKDKGRNEWKRP
jgi:hypothetical protein